MDVVRRTCEWLECQIGIWQTGEIGDCGYAVATPNGSSREEKKNDIITKGSLHIYQYKFVYCNAHTHMFKNIKIV